MDNSFDSSTIETPAGNYTLKFHYDEWPEQPYDEGFVLVTNGSRDQIAIRHGEDPLVSKVADAISDKYWYEYPHERFSGEALVRWLSLKGRHGATIVDSDYRPVDASTDRDERIFGVAWAPDDATYPDEYVKASLNEWRAWAAGEVYGWSVLDPSGYLVDSVWGFYGWDANHEYMRQEAVGAATHDAQKRIDAANTAGAGFVGIL